MHKSVVHAQELCTCTRILTFATWLRRGCLILVLLSFLSLFTGCRLCRRPPLKVNWCKSAGWFDDSMINKQSTCPCKVGKIAGSEVPSLMTGSAGTAMDVLVTCFSKMGGESERRVWKNSAWAVISGLYTDSFLKIGFSRFSFSPNVSKTYRLPYF